MYYINITAVYMFVVIMLFIMCLVFLKCFCHTDTGMTYFYALSQYPVEPPDCVVDFPVPFSVSWTPQVNNKVYFQ